MSVIQRIRDKYARWAVIAIALALTGFILMDAFTGRSRLFSGGNSTIVGRVNGKAIDENEFNRKVQLQEQNEQQRRGGSLGEGAREQIINNLWKEEVDQMLLQNEFDKLGLSVGKKERTDMLYTNPHPLAKQYLGNPQTGEYDPNNAQQIVNSIRRGSDKAQKEQLNILLNAIDNGRLTEKYTSLIAGTIHYPKWVLEKQNADNSLMARVSYVKVPDSLVSDKEAVVTDKEIADFIEKHKDVYKTDDEFRTIQYVLFSAAPTAKDSAAAFKEVESQKQKFVAMTDLNEIKTFVASQSDLAFSDSYFAESAIQVPAKDSIFKLEKNGVYGPYLDASDYVLAKVIDKRVMPDSVKARHILIQTNNPQTGQVLLEDSIAKRRIDSIELALRHGISFDTLAQKFSDDKGSALFGGLLRMPTQSGDTTDYFTQGQMVRAFNDSCFMGKVGDLKKVKTEFGWHLIQILDQRKFEPHYKVAYVAKKIEASEETERNAENASLQFAGESRDLKSFDANFEKNLKNRGYQKLFAPDISSHAFQIPGVGISRKFVRDQVFTASRGDVLQPERVGDSYVVAVVTEINKAGKLSVTTGRRYIEPILRNKKKAAVLKKRIGKVTTLEAVAASMRQTVQVADSIRFAGGGGKDPIAYESKVLGAVFNPANNGKVVPEPLEGNRGGVYVVRVDNISTTVVENADINAQKTSMEARGRMSILMSNQLGNNFGQQQYDPALVLRRAAKIKDNRNKFY